MIKVMLVDDHPALLRGVATVLESDGDVEVVASVGRVSDAEEALGRLDVDVVVTDIRLPDGDGMDLMFTTREKGARLVVFTQYSADRIVMRAFRAGINSYVVKESDPHLLRHAVHAAARGDMFIDPRVAPKLVTAATKKGSTKGPFGLTPQELRVVELLPKGMTNQEIAQHLGLSYETVKTHLRHAMRKLQVDDRSAAAAMIIDSGLV